VIGGVVLLTNDDRNTQLAGAAIITLGAVAIIGNGGFRFLIEWNKYDNLIVEIYDGSIKPLFEGLSYQQVKHITDPRHIDYLATFLQPGDYTLLDIVGSPTFYYTTIFEHRGDRHGTSDIITPAPFEQMFPMWRQIGVVIDGYPRAVIHMSRGMGQLRGTRYNIQKNILSRSQKFFQTILRRNYFPQINRNVPIYFIFGSPLTGNMTDLLYRSILLSGDWVTHHAKLAQVIESRDRDSELAVAYETIDRDRRILVKKVSQSFKDKPMIDKQRFRGRLGRKVALIAMAILGVVLFLLLLQQAPGGGVI